MSEKPSYLGLLNAIAVGEAQAHAYLTAWIATTTDPDVRAVLSTVAAREGEHGMSFAKRLNELGYEVRPRDEDAFRKRMAIAASTTLSDLDKMDQLRLGSVEQDDGPDFFDTIFSDHSIDIATGALLGRYIAEERDSARLLSGCHRALAASPCPAPAPSPTVRDDQRFASLEAKLDALCGAIGEIQSSLSARANGDSGDDANGARHAKPKGRSMRPTTSRVTARA